MEKLKSVGPEILGLFETVQKQAGEYGQAFEKFEKINRDYETIVAKLSALSVAVKEETEKAITNANTNVLESLIILKNKTDETFKLGFDLKNIKSVLGKLETLDFSLNDVYQKSKKQYEEMENAVAYFKKKSDAELDSTIMSFKSRIEKEIQNETQKIELRFSLRFKMVESRIRDLEDEIKNFEENVSVVLRKFAMDIEMLKGEGGSFGSDFSVGGSYHSIQALSERVDSISNTLERANDGEKFSNQKNLESIKEDINKKHTELKEQLTALSNDFEQSKKKKQIGISPSAAFGTALTAVLLAVWAILMAMFK